MKMSVSELKEYYEKYYKNSIIDEEEIEKELDSWKYYRNKIINGGGLTAEEYNSKNSNFNKNDEHRSLRNFIEHETGAVGSFGTMISGQMVLWVKNDGNQKEYYRKDKNSNVKLKNVNDVTEKTKEMNDFLSHVVLEGNLDKLIEYFTNGEGQIIYGSIRRNFLEKLIIFNSMIDDTEGFDYHNNLIFIYDFSNLSEIEIIDEKNNNLFEVLKDNKNNLIKNREITTKIIDVLGIGNPGYMDLVNIERMLWSLTKSEDRRLPLSKENNSIEINDIKLPKIIKAYNKIFYGCPGSGKSYYIKNELLNELQIKEENVIRTTFYEDYSNSDFIGQIYPNIKNEEVTYIFKPGPFTLALEKALKNKNEPVVLIIEEINRGKAPSIFGEIFQLLDRDSNGKSEYSIRNLNLEGYIKVGEIFIPNNLYIIATMNTSDQNVFTLDNAFKRRFNLEMIDNNFNDEDTIKDLYVPGLNKITWKEFKENINEFINELDSEFISEDKQIGKYFVSQESLLSSSSESNEEKTKEFAYKVLEYLYNDIAKIIGKDKIFNPELKTLTSIINKYIELSKENKSLDVFNESLKSKFSTYNETTEEIDNSNEDKLN